MNNDIKAAAKRLSATIEFGGESMSRDIYHDSDHLRVMDMATVAAAFLSHPYGVLKPLEWDTDGDGDYVSSPVYYCVQNGCGLCWDRNDFDAQCESNDHGKQLCEQHYAAEMAKAFTTIGEAT